MKHKLMKRIIGLMTVVSMLGSGIPTGYSFHKTGIMITYADEVLEYSEGNSTYQYLINEDNTIRIIGYSGTDSEIEIPSSIDGKTVTLLGFENQSTYLKKSEFGLGSTIFGNSLTLIKVVIPNTITLIGYDSFRNSSSLKEVVIPNSVTSIYDTAFCSCQNLREISIPDSVTYLGDSVFLSCTSLKNITFPNQLKEIPDDTCSHCSALEKIQLPNAVEKNRKFSIFWLFDRKYRNSRKCISDWS